MLDRINCGMSIDPRIPAMGGRDKRRRLTWGVGGHFFLLGLAVQYGTCIGTGRCGEHNRVVRRKRRIGRPIFANSRIK